MDAYNLRFKKSLVPWAMAKERGKMAEGNNPVTTSPVLAPNLLNLQVEAP